ncbi:MAG: LamG-like jellyroll fold domain-containing protein, partial [Candidatus Zipacnadales bacterium]
HHIAVSWAGLNSQDIGVLRLYLDGKLAAEKTGLNIGVGAPSGLLDIGRDSDASPDYAEVLLDEVFLYPMALTEDQIATAVTGVRRGELRPSTTLHPAVLREAEGWDVPRPYRALIETLPLEHERTDAWFEVPFTFTEDLGQLGLQVTPDPNSFVLVELSDQGTTTLPALLPSLNGHWLGFLASGLTAAGAVRRFLLYFDIIGYDHVALLTVVKQASRYPPAEAPSPGPLNDYATTVYGDAWDFDEGDTESIDCFGDKPEYFRNVRVENGVLKADVSQDPYLIWGSMWGPEDQGERRVRIDLDIYNVLEMRVQQSVSSAQWVLYGRSLGTERLQSHEFRIAGVGWQTVRIDLQREAHWGGVLSAFRIDPTEEVDAEIAIDWVRLLSVLPARRQPVELLSEPSGVPARVELALADQSVTAGHEQPLIVRVTDEAGKAVAGQPVLVRLSEESGGELRPAEQPVIKTHNGLRGLTNDEGSLVVTYAANTRAQPTADTILATTEFPAVAALPLKVDTHAGPPTRLQILSDGVTIFREQEAPFKITFQPVDRFGNPAGRGQVKAWDVADGRLELLSELDSQGRAQALFYPDMKRRWVYTITAATEEVSGESGPICVLPAGPRPDPVTLGPNGYFRVTEGKPYIPLGGLYINVIGLPDPKTAEQGRILKSFSEASEQEIRNWLTFLHAQGVNTLRLMLRTHTPQGLEPMDVGGRVNLPLFAKTLRLLDLARDFDMRYLLDIHDD